MTSLNWLAVAASTLLLAACSAPAPTAPGAVARQGAAPTVVPLAGVDLAGRDLVVRPGDDFESYANGGWRARTPIPADTSSAGAFYDVFLLAEQRTAGLVRGMAENPAAEGSDARRIADAYAAFMDEAGIERRGLAPLRESLSQIDAIDDRHDLARALGLQLRADVDPINNTNLHTEHLFGLFVAQGLEDPTRNVAYLLQGGLGMPNRDNYLDPGQDMATLRGKYEAYIARLFQLAGLDRPEARARTVVALETKIARAHASLVESSDIHRANNPWAPADFRRRAPGLDWAVFFDAAGLAGQDVVVAWQPRAIAGLSALAAREPLPAWQDWLRFHALNESAPMLPRAFARAHFEFNGRDLEGTPQARERWKQAIARVNTQLGDAVGRAYVARYFPPESKARVAAMVANISAAFARRVERIEWMAPTTRLRAQAKARAMRVGVGYPGHWRDYASLRIERDDPVGNDLRASLFEYRHQLGKLGQAVDRDEWWMTPQTVNAVNLPLQNAMNFPAAILEPPFFDPRADDAANYGAIGVMIGHEISHGFDNLGAEFDELGRVANWWTAEDQARFEAAGEALVAQFDAYEPLPGLHINGRQTLGENIADLSGLNIALEAYHASLGGKPGPVIDGMGADQRFFLAFAQVWRAKTRKAYLRQQLVADGHTPDGFRPLTVRNVDAWYRAYGVRPGDRLYLAPAQRVRIW